MEAAWPCRNPRFWVIINGSRPSPALLRPLLPATAIQSEGKAGVSGFPGAERRASRSALPPHRGHRPTRLWRQPIPDPPQRWVLGGRRLAPPHPFCDVPHGTRTTDAALRSCVGQRTLEPGRSSRTEFAARSLCGSSPSLMRWKATVAPSTRRPASPPIVRSCGRVTTSPSVPPRSVSRGSFATRWRIHRPRTSAPHTRKSLRPSNKRQRLSIRG